MQLLPSPSQAHSLERVNVSLGEVSGEGGGDREEQPSLLLSARHVGLPQTAPRLNTVIPDSSCPGAVEAAVPCAGLVWSGMCAQQRSEIFSNLPNERGLEHLCSWALTSASEDLTQGRDAQVRKTLCAQDAFGAPC